MTTDADLAARFDAAIGEGPEHRPLDPALRAGRRRLLGRRLAVAGAAVVVVTAGGAAVAGGSGDQAHDLPPAGAPTTATPSPTGEPPADEPPTEEAAVIRFEGQLAVATADGELVLNPRATIRRQETVRFGGAVAYAVIGTLRGRTSALFTTMDRTGGMSITDAPVAGRLRAWARATLREYVRANQEPPPPPDGADDDLPTPAPPDLVTFPGSELVPAAGVTVTDQVSDVVLRDFAEPGQPTAAARITRGDSVYFLVARPDDVIAVEPPPGIRTLDEWVDFAQAAYASGAGLR